MPRKSNVGQAVRASRLSHILGVPGFPGVVCNPWVPNPRVPNLRVPRLPPFATEQRRPPPTEQRHDPQLSAQDLEAIPEAIQSVLEWLDRIATVLLTHRRSDEYQEALRKSGIGGGESGLSATEQKTRSAIRKAKFDMRTAKALAEQWENRTLTWKSCYRWQKTLLHAYWDASLRKRLNDATSQGSADTMCRTPSLSSVT